MSDHRKQELCLDAIEHSFSMARIAYDRVIHYCRHHVDANDPNLDDTMVLDAWSFVDVAKRLRSVLEHTPGLKNARALVLFLRATEDVVDFRHHMQHMEDRTSTFAPSGRPIWGSFSWVTLDPNGINFRICTYIPGRLAKTKGIPVVNPAGRKFHGDIDHFELSVNDVTLNLSDMSRRIETLREKFNAAVKSAVPSPTRSGETILAIDLDATA
jgi:hypothetical protein